MRLRAALLASVLVALVAPALAPAATRPAGTVTGATRLDPKLWIPGTTGKAFRLTYETSNGRGGKAVSTGELFLPKGRAPKGGWPVISWAHGTSGLGDGCAPSLVGPAEPYRDFPYLHNWMAQGYAIVASDYAGLGTPGLPAYLHGRSEAHNVVDMVKAARRYAQRRLRPTQQLSDRWVALGQSQGGGAAIYTARYATQFGGKRLDYLGAVGTGTPAYIENYVSLLGPKTPPVALPAGVTSYLAYIIASLRDVHPELGIDGILTDTGRKYVGMAETECVFPFEKDLEGVNVGDFFTKPLATLPNWKATIDDYMAMPETGFDKPFFMGHGAQDTDVPYAATATYASKLQANGQPVTFKTYPTDHDGTVSASQKDTIPFVRALFAKAGPGSDGYSTRIAVLDHPTLRRALAHGLRVRITASPGRRIRLVVRRAGKRVASHRAVTSAGGHARFTARFTRAFRRHAAHARTVKLRLRAGGTTRTITLRR
jgi:hypothetical protein